MPNLYAVPGASQQYPEKSAAIAALKSYGVLDTPNEPEFDAIVKEGTKVLRTPIALISLIEEQRQWFKAKIGIDAAETPRSISFCTHALQGNDVFVVEDATKDKRFNTNPMVTGSRHIRFYAGAPLRTATGKRIGTICVIDKRAHGSLTIRQKSELAALASRTMAELEARKQRLASKKRV